MDFRLKTESRAKETQYLNSIRAVFELMQEIDNLLA